ETKEALERQTATSEILRVISSSPTDVQPVFDAIARSAVRLCDAVFGAVFRLDGELIHMVALTGVAPEKASVLRQMFPIPLAAADSTTAQAIVERSVFHVSDAEAPGVPRRARDAGRAIGFRNQLSVPMLRSGEPIGTVNVSRREPGPYSETQIELLKTFADQAVIAIENVRLFKELEARNRDLTDALDQQTATSELLKVIGRSTFDLQPVFQTLAEKAVRLCEAGKAAIYRFDGQVLRVVVAHNVSPADRELLERNPISLGRQSGAARAALERRTIHIHDIQRDPDYTFVALQTLEPVRTVLALPMLRGNELLGAIVIYRGEVQPFTDSHIALMETFADQAAIAIENARLLSELQARTQDLTRSVGELKALGEVSHALSSTLDVDVVLDTIVTR